MSNITQINNQRLFLGFSINKTQSSIFCDIQQKLSDYINTEATQVNQTNFHITLGFLGQVGQSFIPLLIDRITKMQKYQFELCLSELQFWQKPSIICISGLAHANLSIMAQAVQDIAQQLALHQSQYPYQPHVTLFRKATNLTLATNINSLNNRLPINICPIDLHLYSSVNTAYGVHYQIIHSWTL